MKEQLRAVAKSAVQRLSRAQHVAANALIRISEAIGQGKHPAVCTYDAVIYIAVGPKDLLGLTDVLDSARTFVETTYAVIVIDDSNGLKVRKACRRERNVFYLRNFQRAGFSGLLRSLHRALAFADQTLDFKVAVKMDTDALFTGPGLVTAAIDKFVQNPRVGILGSHRRTCTGSIRNFETAGAKVRGNSAHLKTLIDKAVQNGYEFGEHAQGGCYVLSRDFVSDLARTGLLNDRQLFIGAERGQAVDEESIFALYAYSLGFKLDDFAWRGPMAIAYSGIPLSKEEIVAQKKAVIHSVKYTPEDLEIRDWFRKRRLSEAAHTGH